MRDSTLDIAKGLGIFCVVLGHLTVFKSHVYVTIYHFHMPLFFFISGMFFKETTLKECITKKSQRLLLPYIFYWISSRIVGYFTTGITIHKWSMADLNVNPLSGGVLWFLISLWTIHIICTLGYKIGNAKWLMYSVLFGIGLVMGYKVIRLPFYLSQTMLMLPFFLIGLWFYRYPLINGSSCYEYLKSKCITSQIFLLSLIVFFTPCDFLDINGPVIPNPVQYILTPLSGIVLVLMTSKQFASFWKKIKMDKVGKNSIQILGVHATFIPIIWCVTIPTMRRLLLLVDVSLSGESIKNLITLQIVLAVCLTYLSHYFGLVLTRLFPRILK